MHYALETEHQTKSSASRTTHESPHLKPKETQMGKQTYALTSRCLYDNGQATYSQHQPWNHVKHDFKLLNK